ncbi:MAG TPA: hypothetical protein PKI46_04435, partial [Bacteroidales bacterium]|nr:hypothetical protein [Bacteroidales bacterium]
MKKVISNQFFIRKPKALIDIFMDSCTLLHSKLMNIFIFMLQYKVKHNLENFKDNMKKDDYIEIRNMIDSRYLDSTYIISMNQICDLALNTSRLNIEKSLLSILSVKFKLSYLNDNDVVEAKRFSNLFIDIIIPKTKDKY